MFKVFTCVVDQHNHELVLVATVICLIATFTAFFAFLYALEERSRRALFVGVAALASGLGVWSTHFVAMLAYEPGIPISYDVPLTLLSVVVAVVMCGIGWTIALSERREMAVLGGAVIGAGVAAMHYIGMSAVRVSAEMAWDDNLILVSVVLGVALTASAVSIFRRNPQVFPLKAGLLFSLAVCSTHFIGMSAVTLYPHAVVRTAAHAIDNEYLAVIVTAAALVIMAMGLGMALFDRRLSGERLEQARERASLAEEVVRGAAEREKLLAELSHQADITAAALDNMAQGLVMYDADNRLVIYNRRYLDLYDCPEGLLKLGSTFIEIRDAVKAHLGVAEAAVAETARPGDADWLAEREVVLPNGRIIKYVRRNLPGGGWVATHEDVTETRRTTRQIAYLAAHDTLTGLPNRTTFAAHLEAYAKAEQPFGLFSIDLDRFKEVNDTLGHAVGDELLRVTAARLRESSGKHDIVARLGGDEFAVISGGMADSDAAAAVAERIVERLSQPFVFEGHTVVVGASVGICLSADNGCEADELLKMSDLALYCAKDERRGTYRFFEPGMDSRLTERRQMETDLREAIAEGQFEIYYQPLLDMTKGTISSFEALVRWHHPRRGLIPPADFIGLAEDNGLIVPIGEWVMRQACQDAAKWPDDIGVAVNVSPAQLKRGDLIAMTMNALGAAGLEPHRLELEITEAVLLQDESGVRSTLDGLAALGVRIAMDDFGTGYSSLSYLRSFPFNKIKIDRTFVAELGGASDSLSIVQATIQLSQKLGLQITAEGVESQEQLNILCAEGCSIIQGYHVSRPVPLGEVARLLDHYNSGSGQPRAAVG
ncbi:EAL domain-containing protein [Novosphingobium malaysiense]|uniref:Diguanylate cyclase n=1 Tax=Novosphingobium malaysiense TaxID=1348853 RepID=A0A0B1ZN13_9SPHN|nr:EAL domain-containing protein [Novosphingobium malaysiense]KHK90621.1 hypothetical protein LK12_14920 [Novosphingobium malaysiense]